MMTATPLGLILGLIALFVDGRKAWAVAATILAGLVLVFLFAVPLLMRLLTSVTR
jgi:hypothetical protein